MQARKQKTDELNAVLTALIEPTRKEPGCITYFLLNNRQAPEEFTFIEHWESPQALSDHLSSDHIKRALQQMQDLLAAPPDIQQYERIG
jgi:quinol monooxygenase YgiN